LSEEIRTEWLATYHEGDSRIRDKRHGLIRLNNAKQRIEFAVQTAESSPIIVVNYPLMHLRNVLIIDKRQKMKKQYYLQLELGEPPNEITPLFSFSLADLEDVKNEILAFQEEIRGLSADDVKDSEPDVIKTFAQLLMAPIDQFQQVFGEVTSRLRSLTIKPKKMTETLLSPLEPKFPYETREIEINDRKFHFFSTSYSHSTILLLLSPIGGRIEHYYPMISSLLGKYQLIILGVRGFIEPVGQDLEFKLKDYIQDIKDFLDYIGSEKDIVLGAHSLFSAIILEEFLNKKYSNITKFVLVSGAHRVPNNFRKGVKLLPPTQTWGSFKGQVRKIAPKILYSGDTDREIIDLFIKHAFSIPNNVYYQIFKDFIPKYDYTKKLESLNKPLLVVWGEKDQLIPRDLKTEMIECIPPHLLTHKELPGGHMVILEEPNKVAREINRFITKKWSKIEIE
jgi:pimeloyl-ACP methyl ester carboxylesterase